MATEVVTVKGFEELRKALIELPKGIGKNVLRNAVSRGAAVIRAQTKRNTAGFGFSLTGAKMPKGIRRARSPGGFPDRISGTLQHAVYMKHIREGSTQFKQTYYVGARKGKKYQKGMPVGRKGALRKKSSDAYYGKWVERGHRIVARGSRIGTKGGRARYNTTITQRRKGAIGRVPPYPFLEPAYKAKKGQAIAAMKEVFQRRIPEEVRKVAAKGARRI